MQPAQPPAAPTAQVLATPSRTVLDERFQRSWPNDPRGSAWLGEGAYTLFARQPGQFVAIRAPIADVPADVSVSGTFHKVGGPPGGGYGLIVRDQLVGAGDGIDQNGQFLVAAAGDRGEVGVWQRAGSRWIDLLPWTTSPLVHQGAATNELKVSVTATHLRFDVNGARVADMEIGFPTGSIGLFVGGDLNQVQLDRLLVEAAPTTGQVSAAPALDTRPDIPATRTRLAALTARADQDPTLMQDASWRHEMAATLAAIQQIGSSGSLSSTTTLSVSRIAPRADAVGRHFGRSRGDSRRLRDWGGQPTQPAEQPARLDQAAAHLDSAVRQANQVLAEVELARAKPGGTPGR